MFSKAIFLSVLSLLLLFYGHHYFFIVFFFNEPRQNYVTMIVYYFVNVWLMAEKTVFANVFKFFYGLIRDVFFLFLVYFTLQIFSLKQSFNNYITNHVNTIATLSVFFYLTVLMLCYSDQYVRFGLGF